MSAAVERITRNHAYMAFHEFASVLLMSPRRWRMKGGWNATVRTL